MVSHGELKLQFQGSPVALLDPRAALRLVFGHRNPDRSTVGRDTARMEAVSILEFNGSFQAPGLY